MERLKKIKCFLFDMDGTINLGDTLIPGMEGFFEKLTAAGKRYYLLTNNSSKNHKQYVTQMMRLGVPVTEDDIIISTDAFLAYMVKHRPGARIFLLAMPQMEDAVRNAGFTLTKGLEDETDFVVLGFDQTLTYDKMMIACRLIDRGVPYMTTHPDLRCPIEGGEFVPDTGAMIAMIKAATGKPPAIIFGKPYRYIVDLVLEKTGFKKEEIAMVGDRLGTDMDFGLRNGILSVMVLTGEATMENVENGPVKPDVILPYAADILKYI
ncbi:MAG: HAD-IIA family hydrolase [Phascolarctobacterium sp.]|nr:HAD-IIA family hydrolase [Phascolarctobacterium sp.]